MTGAGCGIPAPNIIWAGDSLTEGFGVSVANNYPSQTVALLTYPTDTSTNVAVGGTTAAQWAATLASSLINPRFNRTGAPQIVPLWVGTNDIFFGANAATTYANIKAAANAVRALNPSAKIIVYTVLPRNVVGFEATRASVNTSLRGDFATPTSDPLIWTGASYADYLIDIAGNTTIGDSGDELNTTYYLDGTHLTAAGYAIVAGYAKTAIWFINPPN